MPNFTDDVPANNTIWILGDSLLTDAAGFYTTFFKKRKGDPAQDFQTLYMENLYTIRIVPPGLYTAKQAGNIPNIVLNALVDTLNMKAKVPHSLVLIINDVRFWNNNDLLKFQMERIIARFMKEIRRIIEARNLSLPPKAVNWDYPRVFITRALPLPNNMSRPYPKGFKPNRRKYNKIIHRGETHHNYRSINCSEFTSKNENKLFARDGSMTQQGYRQLWIAISDAIHKADNQDRITLNKARAKQLAAQIKVTKQEMENIHGHSAEISDIEVLSSEDESKVAQPTKRALINDFDKVCSTPKIKANKALSLNSSPISEYFTAECAQAVHQPPHHNPRFHRKQKQKQTFIGKKKFFKNNWKHNG